MITQPYVLFTRIELIRDHQGRLFCDPLWAKDLALHLDYIQHFSLCCPIVDSDQTEGLSHITDIGIQRFFELKKDSGFISVFKNIIPNFLRVKNACREASIVHSGGAGWPFPLSFYLLLLRYFFHFQWLMNIESSFWMLEENEKPTLRKLISHHIHKILLTRCVKKADARTFTQSFYRRYFLGDNNINNTMINPATWVDEELLINAEQVEQRFRHTQQQPLNILFPARLIEEKGIYTIFEAIHQLHAKKISFNITFMGTGDLEQECRDFAQQDHGSVNVMFKETVDYGKPFFTVLGEYDFVLLANVKQEQPRIIFDAFSQGVAVIASDTSGIKDITDTSNAVLFETANADSLAQAIEQLSQQKEKVLQLGLAGLAYASGKTHRQMHRDRQQFLEGVFIQNK